jgi:endonuclease-3
MLKLLPQWLDPILDPVLFLFYTSSALRNPNTQLLVSLKGISMESLKQKKERANLIFDILDPLYTYEKTALSYRNAFQLLIATILSAQCTDKQVNEVTKILFKKYKKPDDFIKVPIAELEMDIRPTGFYRNKAKSLKGCSQGLVDLYGGKVPSTMDELLKLPGVGRKTANCVLGAVFDVPGVVVDTHVKRLSMRLGLTTNEDPEKIEKDVENVLPKERWRRFSDILIYHGREVCKARKPDHERCAVFNLCPSNAI